MVLGKENANTEVPSDVPGHRKRDKRPFILILIFPCLHFSKVCLLSFFVLLPINSPPVWPMYRAFDFFSKEPINFDERSHVLRGQRPQTASNKKKEEDEVRSHLRQKTAESVETKSAAKYGTPMFL